MDGECLLVRPVGHGSALFGERPSLSLRPLIDASSLIYNVIYNCGKSRYWKGDAVRCEFYRITTGIESII
jgi:hypothetical protein